MCYLSILLNLLIGLGFTQAVAGREKCCDVSNTSFINIQTCVETNTTDTMSVLIEQLYQDIHKAECKLDDPTELPPNYCLTPGEEFDYIVVGGGTAGCVVANRLTEDPCCSVLLAEAGGNPKKISEVPAIYPNIFNSDSAWQYRAEPEENMFLGFNDGKSICPTGKMLGGCSSMNGFSFVRGCPEVFDSWAENGNIGWDYESCLKYFIKSEDWQPQDPPAESLKDHGRGGYLSVRDFPNKNEKVLIEAFKFGVKSLGYDIIHDFDGSCRTGFGRLPGTTVNGRRCSSAKAFLKPIRSRDNLKVAKHSLVTKILIDETHTAYGVEVLNQNGDCVKVIARKEVVVCCGVVDSPKLLMLSGIGPEDHLKALGIPCLRDLPVGYNLKDHSAHGGFSTLINPVKKTKATPTSTDLTYEFLLHEDSTWSGIGLFNWIQSLNTYNCSSQNPNVYLLLLYFEKGDVATISNYFQAFNLNEELSQQYQDLVKERSLIIHLPLLVNPKSSGRIYLRSKCPSSPPKIVYGFLTEPEDVKTYLSCADYFHKLACTDKFKALGAEAFELSPSACECYPKCSEDFRICAMRHVVGTSFSPVGTCKMGPKSDPTAVVDPELKVHGINCLRVVDASICPSPPTYSPQCTVYMIAEKAADLIKKSHCC